MLVLAGCGWLFVGGDDSDTRASNHHDPWGGAGVDEPRITMRTEDGHTIVHVQVDATSLPLEDDENVSGFAERVATIAWRTHPGPIDVLETRTPGRGGARSVSQTWQRAELEALLGPRPDGLDEGRKPAPLPGGRSRYTDPPEHLGAGVALYRGLVEQTAQDALRSAPGTIEIHDPQECVEWSFFRGDVPTGTYQQSVNVTVRPPQDLQGHAAGPAVAGYWAGLGLAVNTRSFVSGTGTLYADLPNGGRASLTVLDERPPTVLLAATTGCLDAGTR